MHRLHTISKPLPGDPQYLVGVAAPPVLLRHDLDADRPAVAGLLDQAADAGDVDRAVAHHAAVEHEVAGRHQPVADVERGDAAGGGGDARLQVRVPPDVIDVECECD